MQAIDGINREVIDSSSLASIGYSDERQVLAIEFKGGLVLHYSGITSEIATELYCAKSRGAYYAKNIRGRFSARTMTGPCRACQAHGPIGEVCLDCGQDKHFMVERRREPDRETRHPDAIDQLVR